METIPFAPAWWLPSAHLQTVAAKWLRRNQQLHTYREIISTPDKDQLELAWTELPHTDTQKPIAILLHGLEGSVDSHYVKGMLKAVSDQGWIGVVMHFRGCGQYPNNQGRSYHSGDTEDVHFLYQLLEQRFPHAKKIMIGYSLGGNVLAKFLAESSALKLCAAAIVCAPLDLASCSKRIDQGISKVYQKYLLNMLKESAKEKIQRQLIKHIKLPDLERIETMWDFDHQFTAPVNGFSSAEDYYSKASSKPLLKSITTPCLIIHAKDDPFLCHNSICDNLTLSDSIHFEVINRGGHVGFIAGRSPLKPQFWLEQRIPLFLKQHLNEVAI